MGSLLPLIVAALISFFSVAKYPYSLRTVTSPVVESAQTSQSTVTDPGQYNKQPDVQETGKCKLNGFLPDPICSPGSADPRVTQENINSTICVSGYTTTVRPNTNYTNKLKTQGIKDYGYTDTNLSAYEEDHIIPLEVGGNPSDPKNLFPEPKQQALEKDKVENYLHKQVCNRTMTLTEAQKEISTNWYSIYAEVYLGE